MRHPAAVLLSLLAMAPAYGEEPVSCKRDAPPALFTQDPESGVRLYHWIGAFHEHSSFSDGFTGTAPRDYYRAGAGHCLDFVAGSEHSEARIRGSSMPADCVAALNSPGKVSRSKREACLGAQQTEQQTQWDAHQVQAGEGGNGHPLVGIRGFEWSNEEHNHIGVYFSSHQISARRDGRFTDLATFWNWLGTPSEQGGGSDALATFNHPAGALFGQSKRSSLPDQPGLNPHDHAGTDNWNHFQYHGQVDAQMVGVEVFNSLEGGRSEFIPGYHGLLDNGWHVGAVAGEDEHGTSWGSRCLPKTVLVARAAGHDKFRNALQKRRMYALAGESCDGPAAGPALHALRMEFRLLGADIPQPMGSQVEADRQTVTLQGRIYWEGAGDYRLELVSNGGEVIASADNRPLLEHAVEVRTRERWYYLRVLHIQQTAQPDGEAHSDTRLLAVSSPIWLHGPQQQQTVESGNPWLERRIMNIALRGGELEAPEHTLYAYRQALSSGATALHIELQRTADGQFVALRSMDLGASTNGQGQVSQLTLAELRQLDAAYWFVQGQGNQTRSTGSSYPLRGIATGDARPPAGATASDFRIPTIEEILQAFPQTPLLVDLKPGVLNQQGQEAQLAEILKSAGRGEDVMLLTFLSPQLPLYRAVAPTLSSALPGADIAAFLAPGPAGRPQVAGGHQAILLSAERLLQQPAMERAQTAHLATLAWGIGNCEQMRQLLAGGVDGIVSPRPSALAWMLQHPDATDCSLN